MGPAGFIQILEEMARLCENPTGSPRTDVVHRRLAARRHHHAILGPDYLGAVARRLLGVMDRSRAARVALKFPQRRSSRDSSGAPRAGRPAADVVLLTLSRMSRAASGTTSEAASPITPSTIIWLVPHFEKMLYDNAQLLRPLGPAPGATAPAIRCFRADRRDRRLARPRDDPAGRCLRRLDRRRQRAWGGPLRLERCRITTSSDPDAANSLPPTTSPGAATGKGKIILNRSSDRTRWDRDREAPPRPLQARLLEEKRRAEHIRPPPTTDPLSPTGTAR